MKQGRGWRVYVTPTRSSVKVTDVKRWVGSWVDEFGVPPDTVRIHPTNASLMPTLYTLGVHDVHTNGGTLAFELHASLGSPLGISE